MPDEPRVISTHPPGEPFPSLPGGPAWPVDTPGGRYYAELDLDAPVTREGQLIFFAQFLHSGGRWARLLEGCPLRYHGNRGSEVVNVIGTAALSVLCGHWPAPGASLWRTSTRCAGTRSTRRCWA